MSAPARLDWAGMMRAGLSGLGLSPAQFWDLTPAELRLMLGEPAVQSPLLSDGLAALMAAFPDGKKEADDGGI